MAHSTKPSNSQDKIIDLNDLRIFAYVSSLTSFTLAADALQIHKSSVSRSVARLEGMLETRLLQRPTRKVLLTQRGIDLRERCVEILSRVNETIDHVCASKRGARAPASPVAGPGRSMQPSNMIAAGRTSLVVSGRNRTHAGVSA